MKEEYDNTINTDNTLFTMKSMTWQQYASRTEDILIIPIGSTEQHGPHLPLSVDTVLAEEFSIRIAKQVHGVVAPSLNYGYKSKPFSGGGPLFPGTIDLNGLTLQLLVQDLIDEFVRDGFHRILLFNAHYENEPFIVEAMDLCSGKYGSKIRLWSANWWDALSDDVIDLIFDEVPFPGWALEHAAVTETSLMLHFKPELVSASLPLQTEPVTPAFCYRYPVIPGDIPPTGVLSTAASSSAMKGKIIVDHAITNIVNYLEEEKNETCMGI